MHDLLTILGYFIGILLLAGIVFIIDATSIDVLNLKTLRAKMRRTLATWGAPSRTELALRSIAKERQAQDAKWGRRTYPTAGLGFGGAEAKEREARAKASCDAAVAESRCTFAHVLREEVAELLATDTHVDALAEARQVGAVVCKIIEYLNNYDSIAVRPLRVYVTGEGPSKLVTATLASMLGEQGHDIVSTWHKEGEPRSDYTSMLATLRDRTKALRSADVLVAWSVTDEPHAVVGDVGYALAFGLPVLWVKSVEDRRPHLYEAEDRVTVLRLEDVNALDAVVGVFEVLAARMRKAAQR